MSRVTIEKRGGYVVITPTGELDISNIGLISEALIKRVDEQVIVNLLKLEFFDSQLIQALVIFVIRAKKAKGSLKVVDNLQGKRLIEASGVSQSIRQYDSLEAAMQQE